ncbi:MAG: phosphoribosylformylglycinamidine cyclo-ligase [Deferribacterota bacterium]|nr:phosphoribosylformylglycinamidine cyclo-ligase [Deferribacterota bacterium]
MKRYKSAGVDIDKGNKFVSLIKTLIEQTYDNNVIANYGGFSGLYDLSFVKKYKNPVLASTTDGVGSKLLIAIDADDLTTIGIDLVAMNVNDLLVIGAQPLIFLDYIATHSLNIKQTKEIIKGISKACISTNVSLVGGETAEMPSLYSKGNFDLAGFCAGIVERDEIFDNRNIDKDNIIIGLPSAGYHSNGFTLLREVYFNENKFKLNQQIGNNKTLKDILLEPTKIYTNEFRIIKESNIKPKGCAHITGGGLYDNIKRILPENIDAEIDINSWNPPFCFDFFMKNTDISKKEMYRVFNMGIGMVMIFGKDKTDKVKEVFIKNNIDYHTIGFTKEGCGNVIIKGL